ncbi:hypothetical protein Tco_0125523, partial [Tanacetum coccineum]
MYKSNIHLQGNANDSARNNINAIPSYSARRALFDRFVQTRDEEERKEKRAAHKAAIEGYKQLRMRRRRISTTTQTIKYLKENGVMIQGLRLSIGKSENLYSMK